MFYLQGLKLSSTKSQKNVVIKTIEKEIFPEKKNFFTKNYSGAS